MKRTTRLTALLFILLLLLGLLPAGYTARAAAADLEATLVVSTQTVSPGGSFDVEVVLKNISDSYKLDSAEFKLGFTGEGTGRVSTRISVTRGAASTAAGSTNDVLQYISSYSSGDGYRVRYNIDNESPADASKVIVDPRQELRITLTVYIDQLTGGDSGQLKLSLSDVLAYQRQDITLPPTNIANRLHTFTAKEPFPTATVTCRNKSSDCTLSSLTVTAGGYACPLTPAFSPNVTVYTFSAVEPVGTISVAASCANSNATIEKGTGGVLYSVNGNDYTVTVKAEDGTIMKYTLRLESVPSSTTTTTTTTTTTATTTATVPNNEDTTLPTDTAPTQTITPDEDADKGVSTIRISLLGLIGLIAGEIGLFMLAFLSGYMTHKNASKPTRVTMSDVLAAQEQVELEGYGQQPADAIKPSLPPLTANLSTGMMSSSTLNSQALAAEAAYLSGLQARRTMMNTGADMAAGFQNPMQNGYDPNAMQGGFDPNAMQGGYDPNAMQGGYDPNAMQGGYDPNAMQGGYDPNAMQGGYDPNAMQGGFDPNAMQGRFDPNAMQGGYDPNAMQGGYDPNAMQGGYDPNAMQGGYDPNAMQGGYDPNAMQGGYDPNAMQGGYDPNAMQGGYDPNAMQGGY